MSPACRTADSAVARSRPCTRTVIGSASAAVPSTRDSEADSGASTWPGAAAAGAPIPNGSNTSAAAAIPSLRAHPPDERSIIEPSNQQRRLFPLTSDPQWGDATCLAGYRLIGTDDRLGVLPG